LAVENRPLYRSGDHLILGFHGTSKAIVDGVLKDSGRLEAMTTDALWLGPGIYFWEWDLTHAETWANETVSRKNKLSGHNDRPAVIGAIIRLGNCFDLTQMSPERDQELSTAHDTVAKSVGSLVNPNTGNKFLMPVNKDLTKDYGAPLPRRFLDNAVITQMHLMREERALEAIRNGCADEEAYATYRLDSIRASFQEGPPIFEGGTLQKRTHVQINVLNHICILGYFEPRRLATKNDAHMNVDFVQALIGAIRAGQPPV
jgi:hypothetical protein